MLGVKIKLLDWGCEKEKLLGYIKKRMKQLMG